MNRMWNWYKNSDNFEALDNFINGLKKANTQEGLLLKPQQLEAGDITGSIAALVANVIGRRKMTPHVLSAALEMNKFCNKHYAHTQNEVLKTEMLAIPAFLEAMKSEIDKCVDAQPILAAKSKIVVAKYKGNLSQDLNPFMRDTYDNYLLSFKQTISQWHQSQKQSNPHGKQNGVYEI